MIGFLDGIMLTLSSSLAASIIAKVTVTTALGLIATWMARRSSAAKRHTILAASFGVLFAMPIASVLAPPVRIALPAAQKRTAPAPSRAISAMSAVAPAHSRNAAASVVPSSPEPSLLTLLLAVWIAGMALFLLPIAIGLWQVRSLRRSAMPWPHGQSVFENLALQGGIHRRVEVLLHATLTGPMTCGAAHPAIVLPRDAQTWEAEDLNRAMLHELEHVRRADWVGHCLARAICAAYWFHPLVWIAWRQFALQAERACDDAVLERSEATAYADQLVRLAQRLSSISKPPLLAMASRADLATRVRAVLDNRQRRGRSGTFPVALACAAAALLALGLSPLRMVAAPQSSPEGGAPTFSTYAALVIETVTVFDKDGHSIEGLHANDFAVTEDGVAQTISVFEFQKLAGTRGPLSSYYIVGYYPSNPNVDGHSRQVSIAGKLDTMAKLSYRAGYIARPRPAAAATGSGGLDPGATPPVLLSKKQPEYSDEARKAKWQGTVLLSLDVDASGRPANPKVVHSLGMGLDQRAVEAVLAWKFKPGTKDGNPVTVQTRVEVNYRLW
jgi:TonB family protein